MKWCSKAIIPGHDGTPRLRLLSDFRESYNVWFDTAGTVLRRVTTEGPRHSEMFAILRHAGLLVVPHGAVRDLAAAGQAPDSVVIYLDDSAHRGEGKLRLSLFLDDALSRFPDHLASAYLPPDPVDLPVSGRAESWRSLHLGMGLRGSV